MKVKTDTDNRQNSFGRRFECQNLHSNKSYFDWVFEYSDETYKKFWQENTIRPGVKLCIADFTIDHDIDVDFELKRPPVVFWNVLSGNNTIRIGSGHSKKEFTHSESGMSGISFLPHTRGIVHYPKNQRICMVGIQMSPHVLGTILNQRVKCLPQELRRVINGEERKIFYTCETMKPMARMVLQQILNCPYEGDIRRIYLEGKVIELVAMKLASNNKGDTLEFSKSRDEEKTRQARDILIKDLENTPSLRDLAKCVCLTHTRLSREFRNIYGMSVFSYLRAYRLNYARMLLQDKDMNITEVAYASGFSGPSHFAKDFFRCYGVQPRIYRRQIF